MHRIFLHKSALLKQPVSITGEKAHYLFSVLRCKTGDTLVITDEQGLSSTAQILTVSKKEVSITITGNYVMNTESTLNVILIQGLLKGEKMDFVVQKATELGVTSIIPVITERSQLRGTRKRSRWQKIAEEGSRQSARTKVPEVFEAADYTKVFHLPVVKSGKGIIFWEEGEDKLSLVIRNLSRENHLTLLIGPEGGFSEREAALAAENGFFISSLGSRILRAETASIAAISIIQYSLGDLGGQSGNNH
jgi:16S rRNA (uracil1498-N3)-methyltransferase